MPHSAIKIHENENSPYGAAGDPVGLAVKRLNGNQTGCWLEPGINWEHSSCELGTRRCWVSRSKCQAASFKSLWAARWTAPGGLCSLCCVFEALTYRYRERFPVQALSEIKHIWREPLVSRQHSQWYLNRTTTVWEDETVMVISNKCERGFYQVLKQAASSCNLTASKSGESTFSLNH